MSSDLIKEFTLKELAKETGVPERTIRFYISRKLVPPPHRGGPGAAYGEEHKARILKIRELQQGRPEQGQPGLMLAEIELLLAAEETDVQSVSPARLRLIEEPVARTMAMYELNESAVPDQINLVAAGRDMRPAASLPEPETWRSYEVADDVRVMFRTGAGPWRTKLVLGALRWFTAAVKNSNAKEDKGE